MGEAAQPGRIQVNVAIVLIVYRRVHVVVVQLEPATATVQNKFNNWKSNKKKTQNYFNNIYIYYRQDKKMSRSSCVVSLILKQKQIYYVCLYALIVRELQCSRICLWTLEHERKKTLVNSNLKIAMRRSKEGVMKIVIKYVP